MFAPHDSSTILISVRTAQLCQAGEPCLNAANPRFTYSAVGFDLTDTEGPDGRSTGLAQYNAWTPAISQFAFGRGGPERDGDGAALDQRGRVRADARRSA